MSAGVKPVACRYFASQGAEATALIEQGRALNEEHMAKIDAFQRRHAADATSQFGNGSVHALAYLAEPGEMPKARPGMKFAGHDENSYAELYHLYQPDKRTPAGKAIAAEARAIGTFNLSTWLTRQLGAQRSVVGAAQRGLLLHCSYAGARKGRLLLCVPVDKDEPYSSPAWLPEIARSTFVAYSED